MSSQIFSYVAQGISPYGEEPRQPQKLALTQPKFLFGEGEASKALIAQCKDRARFQPTFLQGVSCRRELAQFFDGPIIKEQVIVLYDEMTAEKCLRYAGEHEVPQQQGFQVHWCVGVPYKLRLQELVRDAGDELNELLKHFSLENMQRRFSQGEFPWGEAFPRESFEKVTADRASVPSWLYASRVVLPRKRGD